MDKWLGCIFNVKWSLLNDLLHNTLCDSNFFKFSPSTRLKKSNLCQVVRIPIQKCGREISKWFDVRGRQLARVGQEIKHNLAEVSFFPSRRREKFKETFVKQGNCLMILKSITVIITYLCFSLWCWLKTL